MIIRCKLDDCNWNEDNTDYKIMLKCLKKMGLLWDSTKDRIENGEEIVFIELVNEVSLFRMLLENGISICNSDEIQSAKPYSWDIVKLTDTGFTIMINHSTGQRHVYIPFTNVKAIHDVDQGFIDEVGEFKSEMKKLTRKRK